MSDIKWYIIPATIINLILLCVACGLVRAEIPESQAVSCIIGEAEGQGAEGIKALAHVLKNRGTTKGVYGCTSRRVRLRLYSSKTFVQAVKAWEEAKTGYDVTLGATGWGNEADLKVFRRSKWFQRCKVTVKIGDHWFYKEVKK